MTASELVDACGGLAVGGSVPLGSAERPFATAIVAVAVWARFGQLDSPCQRVALDDNATSIRFAVRFRRGIRSVKRIVGGVDRPVDWTSNRRLRAPRTPRKKPISN